MSATSVLHSIAQIRVCIVAARSHRYRDPHLLKVSVKSTHLLVAVREVHEALVVVVVVRTLGRVGGQQQVVGAQPMALRVRVREDARLQKLVVRVVDAYTPKPESEDEPQPLQLAIASLKSSERACNQGGFKSWDHACIFSYNRAAINDSCKSGDGR